MKLVYCKMAAANLEGGGCQYGSNMLPFCRSTVDRELSNLLDKVPAHYEIQFNFSMDVLAEKNPARFFFHRYLNSWYNDFYDGDFEHVAFSDLKSKNFFNKWYDFNYRSARAGYEDATSAARFHCPDRNMAVENFFMEPYVSTIGPVISSSGKPMTGNLPIPAGTRPREQWLNLYERMVKADPDWVRAGGCHVVAQAILSELAILRARLEASGELEKGEELRPMILNSNKFTQEVVHAIARQLQSEGYRTCEITPREFPTFEVYDAPIAVTDTAYVSTGGVRGVIILAMGLPGVHAHSEECLIEARKHEDDWFQGRWMLASMLKDIKLPTAEGTVASGHMRMQKAMDELHFNEEYAINTLFPAWDPDGIYLYKYTERGNEGNSVARYPRPYQEMPFLKLDRKTYAVQLPRSEQDKICGYHDHVRLHISDRNRDEWRYRICRMFYTITYQSRHYSDSQAEAVLRVRIAEFLEVLTQYRDRQLSVYRHTYGELFTQHEADFEKDPLQGFYVIASEPIQALYRNIAMLNRMIADTATI